VGGDGDACLAGLDLVRAKGSPPQDPVRADGGVVGPEPIEVGSQLGQSPGSGLIGQAALESLLQAIDFGPDLRIVRAGVLVVDI
jgi:hypothetical protein